MSTDLDLNTSAEILEEKILNEKDMDELKKVIDLFNLNIKRKNIIRNSKLNELQDKITTEMSKRIDANGTDISDKDLLGYFKAIQETLDRNEIEKEITDIPQIQINQQQINLGVVDTLDINSRKKVTEFISKFMSKESLNTYTDSSVEQDIVGGE